MVDKVDLIATRAMTYSTRRLIAEDPFQASRRDARILVAIGKARFVNPAEQPAPKPKADPKPIKGTRRAAPKPKAD